MSGRRLALVAVVVALLAGAVALDRVVAEPDDADATTEDSGLPTGEELSAAWFCADGTSAPDARADEAVLVGNLGADEIEALLTVMPGGEEDPVTSAVTVAPGTTSRVEVADILEAAEPGVVVEIFGGPAIVEHELRAGKDLAVGPCARGPESRWMFAAGTTVRGVSQYLALFNPFGEDAVVDITYLVEGGPEVLEPVQGLVVPRRSRVTVPVHEHVRREGAVAVDVQARSGRVVAEESMVFADTDDGRAGITLSVGASEPAPEWWFPFGEAAERGDVSVAVGNPSELPVEVEVLLLVDGDETGEPQRVDVPPLSVAVLDLAQRLPVDTGFAVEVRAQGEVVAEQLVSWRGQHRGIATTLGASAPATRWAFAVGSGSGDDGGIVVMNPGTEPTRVRLVTLVGGQEDAVEAVDVAAGERTTFDLGRLGVAGAVPVLIVADTPVAAARVAFTDRGATLGVGVPG
jgi:hypothetical protein